MARIITLTFNPCIDKSTSVAVLIPEKKLICTAPILEPGGGGINVARAIKKLGGQALAIYPAGGYTGAAFNELIKKEQLDAIVIATKNETRENIIVLDESANNQYRFGMPGNELSNEEWNACINAVEKNKDVEFIVVSGSLPPGVPVGIYSQLAQLAHHKKAKLIVDTSGEALNEAIKQGVYLIKPNLGELSRLADRSHIELHEVEKIAREIIAQGKCEVMVVSMGAAGAMLVTKTISATFTPPQVVRKSTIGAGDSMVAGMVHYLSSGHSLEEAVQYGVASGSAATMNPGTALCKKEDADRLYGEIKRI